MITAKTAAEKWGLSLRSVQDHCRKGHIPGAEFFGRNWMIPEEATRPEDGRRTRATTQLSYRPLIRRTPYLTMTDLYHTAGQADKCAEAIAEYPEEYALFKAEIDYMRGNIDSVYSKASFFLENSSGLFSVMAGSMLLAYCALWRGDVELWRQSKAHLFDAPCQNDTDREIVNVTLVAIDSEIKLGKNYPEWFAKGRFYKLPFAALPAARVYYVRYLYLEAEKLAKNQITAEEVTGLGLMRVLPYIIEPMLAQISAEKVVLAEVYLRLRLACIYRYIGDKALGTEHLTKALEICLADGLYVPLVEYRDQLGFFLDDNLSATDPEALKIVKELHRQYRTGWMAIRNAESEVAARGALTVREQEVARLAAFGLSNAEIAERLSLSVHTVSSVVSSAMNKLGVFRRKELGAFI